MGKLYAVIAMLAGVITRVSHTVVEAITLDPTKTYKYGMPLKITDEGIFVPIEAGDTAAVFAGILARSDATSAIIDADGEGVVNQDMVQARIRSGYCAVRCKIGKPKRDGKVYMRVVADEPAGKFIGDFEADADGANNVELVGVMWGLAGTNEACERDLAEIYIK